MRHTLPISANVRLCVFSLPPILPSLCFSLPRFFAWLMPFDPPSMDYCSAGFRPILDRLSQRVSFEIARTVTIQFGSKSRYLLEGQAFSAGKSWQRMPANHAAACMFTVPAIRVRSSSAFSSSAWMLSRMEASDDLPIISAQRRNVPYTAIS